MPPLVSLGERLLQHGHRALAVGDALGEAVCASARGCTSEDGGGGGGDTQYTQRAWLWPLPPAGPVTFALAWPEQQIDEATVQVDGALFRAAAAEAQQLWPPLTPEERAAAMERRVGGSHGHAVFVAFGSGEGAKK